MPIVHPFYKTLKAVYFKLPGGGRITLIGGLMLVMFIIGIIVAHRTRFDTKIYALGGGTATAQLMGVPVGRTTSGVPFSVQVQALGVADDAVAAIALSLERAVKL